MVEKFSRRGDENDAYEDKFASWTGLHIFAQVMLVAWSGTAERGSIARAERRLFGDKRSSGAISPAHLYVRVQTIVEEQSVNCCGKAKDIQLTSTPLGARHDHYSRRPSVRPIAKDPLQNLSRVTRRTIITLDTMPHSRSTATNNHHTRSSTSTRRKLRFLHSGCKVPGHSSLFSLVH